MGTLHYDLPNHVKTYDLKKLENFKKIPEIQATQRVNSDMR